MRGNHEKESYSYPCLTMHQPWASLLVCGIKRIEGRSWPAPLRGRLWIHAASKVPDPATIKAMENFYREIYALDGIKDLKFPECYPLSRLIGCIEVVGCVTREELACWDKVPEGVRLEGMTDFCWLCEKPEKVLVPYQMRGYQGVFNLDQKIYEAAVRDLCVEEGAPPIEFPLPNPRDPLSLKPGSLVPYLTKSKASKVEIPPTMVAVIAGARAASTQFSKREVKTAQLSRDEVKHESTRVRERHISGSSPRQLLENGENGNSSETLQMRSKESDPSHKATQFSRMEAKHQGQEVQERQSFDSLQRHHNGYTDEYKVSSLKPQWIYQEGDIAQRATGFSKEQAKTTQFSDKGVKHEIDRVHQRHTVDTSLRRLPQNIDIEGDKRYWRPQQRYSTQRASESYRKEVNPRQFETKEAKNTQYMHQQTNRVQQRRTFAYKAKEQPDNNLPKGDRRLIGTIPQNPRDRSSVHYYEERFTPAKSEGDRSNNEQDPQRDSNQRLSAPSKIFVAALKGLRPG